MFKGYRWLTAGIVGAVLVTPGVSQAQGVFGQDPVAQPGVASPASGLPQAQGSFKAPAPIRPGQPISVLVFPFGLLGGEEMAPAEGEAPAIAPPDGAAAAAAGGLSQRQAHVTSYATAAVKAGLLASPFFSVATFHPTSALVQRAQKDDVVKPEHLTGIISPASGGADPEKARTLTYRLGMQALLTGSVDIRSDAKANTSEVTLETQLVNSTTGEVIRSAAVSGAAAGAEGVPLSVVEERAAQDAAQKVLPALGIELVTPQTEAAEASKKGSSKRRAKKASADQKPTTDKQAQRAAKKAAEAARRAEEAARRQEKAAAEKAARAAREQERAAAKARKAAGKNASSEKAAVAAAKVQQDDVAQAPATPAAPANSGTPVSPEAVIAPTPGVSNSVPATANAAGQPVPYGYALGENASALPERDRKGLRIPPWLGVAGFLYGLSFLVF